MLFFYSNGRIVLQHHNTWSKSHGRHYMDGLSCRYLEKKAVLVRVLFYLYPKLGNSCIRNMINFYFFYKKKPVSCLFVNSVVPFSQFLLFNLDEFFFMKYQESRLKIIRVLFFYKALIISFNFFLISGVRYKKEFLMS